MFRSSTIIRELAVNLAKVIFMLKHLVKLRHYLLYGCVATYAATQPHNKLQCNLTKCFNINITLARFSAGSLMMVEDRNM